MNFLDINSNYFFKPPKESFQKFSKKVRQLLKSQEFNGFLIASSSFVTNKKDLSFSYKEINNLRNKEVCLDIQKRRILLFRYVALELFLRKKSPNVAHKSLIILLNSFSSNHNQLTPEWFKDSHKHNMFFWIYEHDENFFKHNLDASTSYKTIENMEFEFSYKNNKDEGILEINPIIFLNSLSEKIKSLEFNFDDYVFLVKNNILVRSFHGIDGIPMCPVNLTKKEDIISFLEQKQTLLKLVNEKV